MPIVAMDVIPIELTLSEPVPMSSEVASSTGNVVVRLTDHEGVVGWGEGVGGGCPDEGRRVSATAGLDISSSDQIV